MYVIIEVTGMEAIVFHWLDRLLEPTVEVTS